MKSIEIDRSKRLKDDPGKGHNRWHPDIPPILEVDPGEDVVLETRDASDGQMKPSVTVDDFPGFAGKVGHPLTGPVYIKGAEPGDLLEIEYIDVIPQSYGWTRNRPGAGFLRDLFPDPFVAHWEMKDGWATSKYLPGVRIPNGSFMGTAGIAPSRAQLEAWTAREADLVRRGGTAFPPDAEDAVPHDRVGKGERHQKEGKDARCHDPVRELLKRRSIEVGTHCAQQQDRAQTDNRPEDDDPRLPAHVGARRAGVPQQRHEAEPVRPEDEPQDQKTKASRYSINRLDQGLEAAGYECPQP